MPPLNGGVGHDARQVEPLVVHEVAFGHSNLPTDDAFPLEARQVQPASMAPLCWGESTRS